MMTEWTAMTKNEVLALRTITKCAVSKSMGMEAILIMMMTPMTHIRNKAL